MDNTLTIYGKPGCPGRTWLVKRCQRKGVPYHYVDVTQDAAAFAHIKNLGYLSAPVGEIGDDHWYGARFDKIDQLAARMAKAS